MSVYGNKAISKLRQGQEVAGSFTFSPDPAHTEIMGLAGLDFVMIDLEHAPLTITDVVAHIRAAELHGISPFVRVRHNNPADVGRILDAGASGIMFPHVGLDPEATKSAMDAMRYNPEGIRPSCTGVRAIDFGLSSFSDYVTRSNSEVISIGLIEDQVVVEKIDEVLEEYQLDIVIPGSGDIATSLGLPGEHTHPKVVESLMKVVDATIANGKSKVGMYLADPKLAPQWRDKGVEFFLLSIDYRFLAQAYGAALQDIKSK